MDIRKLMITECLDIVTNSLVDKISTPIVKVTETSNGEYSFAIFDANRNLCGSIYTDKNDIIVSSTRKLLLPPKNACLQFRNDNGGMYYVPLPECIEINDPESVITLQRLIRELLRAH